MTLWHLIAVGVGGALGSIARFVVSRWTILLVPGYPALGTLIVNVVGSLAIGFLAGAGVQHRWLSDEWRIFLVTGVLGGLTTFSSLALETALLSRHPAPLWHGAAHLVANVVLGLAAVLLGERLATWWTV
ncbi:MAG: CrcB family protein [Planctomycetaceae bacterium]|nr:CrcB family protein [Planctomycetaceae bacterium]